MSSDYKFEGWLGHDAASVEGKMVWGEFEPKPWEETDVDIKVTHSGICGTDIHSLRSGWGPADYPLCVGHEIVGHVVRVGSEVASSFKVGDRVGVGAQNDSCRSRFGKGPCSDCDEGLEQYCSSMVATYNARHFNGGKSMGGHATYHRCPGHFAIKIPDAVPSEQAAPLLCGGLTLYSPLKHWGCGPSKTVGVIGVGGLGHFGVVLARALGAKRVVGISRRREKRDEVLKMGADEYIATDEDEGWAEAHKRSIDLLLCTISSSKAPILDYVNLLRRDGTLVQVGNPDDGGFTLPAGVLLAKRVAFAGSTIGSPAEIRDMFDVVAKAGCQFWVEQRPMADANQALVDMEAGKARYRYVLTN